MFNMPDLSIPLQFTEKSDILPLNDTSPDWAISKFSDMLPRQNSLGKYVFLLSTLNL